MSHYSLVKLGTKNNSPRIWLENKYKLEYSGFLPSVLFHILLEKNGIRLIAGDGKRKVSYKRKKASVIPVIDINCAEIKTVFNQEVQNLTLLVQYSVNTIFITLEPSQAAVIEREKALLEKIDNKLPIQSISLFTGSGFLDYAIKSGMSRCGVSLETLLINDINERYLDNGLSNNPALSKVNSIVGGIEWLHRFTLPKADILIAGLPCVGFSLAGKAKNKISSEIDHPLTGHLFVFLLNAILQTNPAIVIIENVEQAINSTTFQIINKTLQANKYTCQQFVINSWEFGSIEQRKRLVFIAFSINLKLDVSAIKPEDFERMLVSDILDNTNNHNWSKMEYLREKEKRDIVAGKGFKMKLISETENMVPTIGRGYFKNRSTEPKLINKNHPDLLRLFTSTEHARLKGFSPSMVADLPEGVAHEVLGNGVAFQPFAALGKLIAEQLVYRGD